MIRKNPTPFTAEEDALMLKWRAEGRAILDISKAMNRPRSSVGNRLRRLLDGSKSHLIGKTQIRCTAEEDAQLIRWRAEGRSIMAISEAMNRQSSSVCYRLRLLLGLPKSPSAVKGYVRPSLPHNEERKNGKQEDLADQKRTIQKARSMAGVCKCLGGCGKTFLSPDRLRIRVCPVCKKREAWKTGDLCHSLSL